MKRKYRKLSLLGLIPMVALIFISGVFLKSDTREIVLVDAVVQTMDYAHYKSVKINDKFSGKAYDMYLEALDFSKKFLLQEDVEKLNQYRLAIDDEIKGGDFPILDDSDKIMVKRYKESREYAKEVLASPFNFDIDEEIELDPEKLEYATTKEEMKESWRKAMKYQVMLRVSQQLSIQEKGDSTVEIKTLEVIEQEAREKVLEDNMDWIDRLEQMERKDRLSMLVNAITSVYDPHTTYFPPRAKENFDIAMSGKLEGIGAVLTTKNGYVKVSEIMPGGPSWKQGELEEGDLILKVGQGEEEPVDVVNMRLDEAVKLIRGKKGSEVKLTVRKLDDQLHVISIIRDVIELKETYARSAVIKNDEGEKFGYIYLPRFYIDFNDPNGRSCSEDVKKEIIKLKKEGVEGMILDLRNNGGGSLQDVVKMAGYFIPTGPVVQIKGRRFDAHILRDKDPEVVYDGPLVVMVNSVSASASEIMAAAMQDYHRALIVGSPNTYGKGTVQQVLDLDELITTQEEGVKPLGAVKLTTQKFYRINGGATQLKGVTPDIILPDQYNFIEFGERELDNALKWSSIKKTRYTLWPKEMGDVDKIRKRSSKRVSKNKDFKVIQERAKQIKDQRDISTETLNLKKYRAKLEKQRKESENYREVLKKERDMEIYSTKADIEALKTDSIQSEIIEKWIKNLNKDIYLNETINILDDMEDK